MALAESMPRMVTMRDGRVERDEQRHSPNYRQHATPDAPSQDEPPAEAAS